MLATLSMPEARPTSALAELSGRAYKLLISSALLTRAGRQSCGAGWHCSTALCMGWQMQSGTKPGMPDGMHALPLASSNQSHSSARLAGRCHRGKVCTARWQALKTWLAHIQSRARDLPDESCCCVVAMHTGLWGVFCSNYVAPAAALGASNASARWA